MAISLRSTQVTPSSYTASLVLSMPSGAQAGDVLIAQVASRLPSGQTLTAPAGWTLIGSMPGIDVANWAFYRVASASEPSSYTWTWSAQPSGQNGGSISAWRGVDNSAAVDAALINTGRVNSASITAPSISPSSSSAMLLSLFATEQSGNIAPPSDETVAYNQNAGGYSPAWALSYKQLTASGATSQEIATIPSSAYNTGGSIALKPAVSGGSTVSIAASGASTSGCSASSAVARPIDASVGSASASALSASVIRSVVSSGASASESSGFASARRAGVSTLTSDSSVAGLAALIRSAVLSIASSTANVASASVRRAVDAIGGSVSTFSANASVVGSVILGAAPIVSATTVSASAAVLRGVSAVSDATSGVLANGVLQRIAAAVFASISAVQTVGQVAGSALVASTTSAITLDMELSDTVVIDAGLADTVQLLMPLEEV